MKRQIVFMSIILLLICNSGFSLQKTLIDFTTLTADYDVPNADTKENQATLVNYSSQAGARFTDEEKELMVTSLALNNWRVELASSSRTVERMKDSMTKEATTTSNARPFDGEEMASKTIMGIRILFPESAFNSYAIIKPPFEIQAYQDKEELQADGSLVVNDEEKGRGQKFDGFGVIKNVGVIKEIECMAYGANYPHALEVILMDENYTERSYHLDYLNFEGWKRLTWTNPNYISEVRNREIQMYPLYPRSIPYRKLIGFVIYRDAASIGGDFITYIKDVKITYDEAIREQENAQIDDESIWGILQARNEARQLAEYKRLGNRQVLELLEKMKMDSGE